MTERGPEKAEGVSSGVKVGILGFIIGIGVGGMLAVGLVMVLAAGAVVWSLNSMMDQVASMEDDGGYEFDDDAEE